MPKSRRNSLGRNHGPNGKFLSKTQRASRKSGSQTRKAVNENAVTVGSKAQVFHGTAKHTAGGLTQSDLVMNKHGRIVSRKQQAAGKKALKHLVNAGYKAKKGEFKLMKKQ
jgi:hypothetical protein